MIEETVTDVISKLITERNHRIKGKRTLKENREKQEHEYLIHIATLNDQIKTLDTQIKALVEMMKEMK